MKPTETRITFIMDEDEAELVQLVASKLMCGKDDGTVAPCTRSAVIRELLGSWLDEHGRKWYPEILAELKACNIHSRLRNMLEEVIKTHQEGEN